MSSDIEIISGGATDIPTCQLRRSSYPGADGCLIYTNAAGSQEFINITEGNSDVIIACTKIYLITTKTKIGLMDDTSAGTNMKIGTTSYYCTEIEVPASKYADKIVTFTTSFS